MWCAQGTGGALTCPAGPRAPWNSGLSAALASGSRVSRLTSGPENLDDTGRGKTPAPAQSGLVCMDRLGAALPDADDPTPETWQLSTTCMFSQEEAKGRAGQRKGQGSAGPVGK